MCKVSVLMSTYKETESYLRQAIESILDQTFKDFEFIIILDNPENELHKNVIKEYQEKDIRIKLYINEKNIGLTASLNRAIKESSGKYICRMDADDISRKDRIEKELDYLIKNDCDLVGGITRIVDENNRTVYSIKKIPSDYDKIKKIIKYNQCIAHPTWLGKREVFIELDGYRNAPYCEDYDFTLRAILRGYKISNLNYEVLSYRMTASSISRNNLLRQFLSAKYITMAYKKGIVADLSKIDLYILDHYSEKKEMQYSKANKLFNDALKCIETKHFIKCFRLIILLLFTSKEYLQNIYRFFMVQINSF